MQYAHSRVDAAAKEMSEEALPMLLCKRKEIAPVFENALSHTRPVLSTGVTVLSTPGVCHFLHLADCLAGGNLV